MFIARQPIFNDHLNVFAYELLFRATETSKVFDGVSSKQATASVVAGLFEHGIEDIVGSHRAFVNFDEDFLKADLVELISPDHLVIEILEDVHVDENLINRIRYFKKKGYLIALDDFFMSYEDYPLSPYADIIKYDLLTTPLESIEGAVASALSDGKILLAEKVENDEVFQKAKAMGFKLFQGYFFSKPHIVAGSKAKKIMASQYIQLLLETKEEEPSYQRMAEIIEKDTQMSYKLLKVVSLRSAGDSVYSIRKALTYLGLKEIERWVNILMIQDLGESKPKELTRISLIRSKFMELMMLEKRQFKLRYEASMLGIFSTLDAMLDENMKEALEGISIPPNVYNALVHCEGVLNRPYRIILSYEKGDFDRVESIALEEGVLLEKLSEIYKKAVLWSEETLEVMGG